MDEFALAFDPDLGEKRYTAVLSLGVRIVAILGIPSGQKSAT